MAFGRERSTDTAPAPVPPVTRAHQELLQLQLQALATSGHNVDVLRQLIESLPALQATLNDETQRRIAALDSNEALIANAVTQLQQQIAAFDAFLVREHDRPIPLVEILVSPSMLDELLRLTQALAEAAADSALRISDRQKL